MPDNCSCIKCTISFGQNLTNLINTWHDFSSRAANELQQVLSDVQASTSALQQLRGLLEADQASTAFSPEADTAAAEPNKIFTPEACQEVEGLAAKCHAQFKAVVLLLQRAVERRKKQEDEKEFEQGKITLKSDEKVQVVRETVEAKEEREQEEAAGLLVGPVVDLKSMKALGLTARLGRKEWNWLEERIEACQKQLRLFRKELLLHLQIAKFAQLQIGNGSRVEGSFESELIARFTIHAQQKSVLAYVKRYARKQKEREAVREKNAEIKKKQEESEDAVSIKSSSSNASAKTIVVDQASPIRKPDQQERPPLPQMPLPSLAPMPTIPPPPMVSTAPTPSTALKKAPKPKDGKKASKQPSKVSPSAIASKISETMSEWTERIFGKDDVFTKDSESQELEAWITLGTASSFPMKVPFGHKRLQYGLKTLNSGKLDQRVGGGGGRTTFARFLSDGPRQQIIVDDVVRVANWEQRRERVCLAYQRMTGSAQQQQQQQQQQQLSFTIVFLSIQPEKPPIEFVDCVGRSMRLPFNMCKTWDAMRTIINNAFWNLPSLSWHVLEGHYDILLKEEGGCGGDEMLVSTASLWETTVQPGASVRMVMWPNPGPAPPHFCGPRPLISSSSIQREMNHRTMRSARLGRELMGLQVWRPPPPTLRPRRSLQSISTTITSATSSASSSSSSVVSSDFQNCSLSLAEENVLTVVDFVAELARLNAMGAGMAGLLGRYTYVEDLDDSRCLEWEHDWDSGADSDATSDCGSSTTGTSIFDD